MSDSIFTDSFLARVKEILDANCPEGASACMTGTQLGRALSLPPEMRLNSAVRALVAMGKVPGYEARRGPAGGIGRVGEVFKKKASDDVVEVTEEFKGRLMATLQTLCDNKGTCVSRDVIAEHMNAPKSTGLISQALRLDEFDEFETRVGRGGGVRRVVASDTDQSDVFVDNLEAVSDNDVEKATDELSLDDDSKQVAV